MIGLEKVLEALVLSSLQLSLRRLDLQRLWLIFTELFVECVGDTSKGWNRSREGAKQTERRTEFCHFTLLLQVAYSVKRVCCYLHFTDADDVPYVVDSFRGEQAILEVLH